MRKSLAAVGLATALTLGGSSSALAQSTGNAVAQADAEDNGDDGDNTGLWGLLGLLGLAGLAGLKRRDDDRIRPAGGYDANRQP